MPEKYYVNFKHKVVVPFNKEYYKKDWSVLDCANVLVRGMGLFMFGENSPIQEFSGYLDMLNKDNKK